MNNSKYKNVIEPGLIYGAIIGGVIILHSIVLYVMNATFSTYQQIMQYILPFLLLTYSLHAYRKEYQNGIISYSKGLGMGIMFSFVSAILGVIYLIILVKFIDPGYLELVNNFAEEKMLEKGLDEESIEKAMEFTERFRSLGFMSVMTLFSSILTGGIYSAIIMIFLKKGPKDPFVSVE